MSGEFLMLCLHTENRELPWRCLFVVTGGTGGCSANRRYRHWRQTWRPDNSVFRAYAVEITCMFKLVLCFRGPNKVYDQSNPNKFLPSLHKYQFPYPLDSLKTESYHDANVVVTDVNGSCRNSGIHGNSIFSDYVASRTHDDVIKCVA